MDLFNDPAPAGPSDRLTLAALLDRFDEVETESNGYVVTCPAHEDARPSLRVGYNAESRKVGLKCRAGCETRDVLTALDLSMADLFDVEPGPIDDLRSAGRVPEKPSVGDRAALKFYLDRAIQHARDAETAEALDYAYRRFGVDTEKFWELGLGYDDGTVDGGKLILSRALYHDAPRLVVPFNDFDGHPHYLQARALREEGVRAKWSGPKNPEGAAWSKYGYFSGGSGWAEVVVTEGPGDALTAAALGYDVILIRGAGLGANAALADELAAGLAGRRVVVAGDADTAGAKFTRDVAAALSTRKVEVHKLTIPVEGGNDITKWRELAGAAFDRAFVQAVQEAPRYGSDEITVEQIAQDITRLFSDVYNAKTLLAVIQEQGGDVRFTTEAGFIAYRPDAGTWQVDHAEWVRSQAQTVAARVQRAILDRMQAMDTRVAGIDDKALRETTGDLLDAQRKKARSGSLVSYVMSTKGIDSMIRELRALPGVFASYEDFDQHPHLLACGNGVVNLESGDLAPYSAATKDLLLLRRVETSYLKGARNPRWEKFLGEIFEKYPDLPAYMKRLVGYGITGHTTEQALAVFYGGGSNGKGVFIETLTGIFKGISTTTPFSTFEVKPSGGIPNDIAALKGSRLVMASEGEQGRQMAEAVIKRLTGGDTISARFMRKEFFEFVPAFLIMLATNYKPNFRGQDYGLWRRVKLVPFDRTFTDEDKDKYLTAKFLGKRVPDAAYRDGEDYGDGPAGILAWAVEGAREWFRETLQDPEVVTRATAEFKETSDNLAEFYAEHLVKDPKGRIKGQDVWGLYQEWCEEEQLDRKERWKRSTFWKALEERGAVKTLPSGTVTFKGIRKRRPSEHGAPEKTAPGNSSEESRAEAERLAEVPVEGAVEAPSLDAFL
ncbi:phage/plasmid primase, P4 family [Amycolatopsis sp. PS_44_ISF1]|uniref:phage/plasmid primase, P4 family n=1 Tax=Amycolatopsis sp. PS_44_ISF1 TaxID=2974917 RepID=UPI0028DEB82A|nr:phage/plasmid primase, P4 family [Amycolatopsis sp. PS_44_ISF1]MDT8915793.1 phage/plasmid primase, P4 family [Amycolatopsis sp. PS_44_ISF1]MDT8916197.1 phage/plasmid primase, P4 family [Amycolatopsis sp. PS_44_ISF1]